MKDAQVSVRDALGEIGAAAAKDMAIMFGALLLLALFLPQGTRLGMIQPHPFCIPVLFTSVRYGSRAGLVAAAIAAVLSIVWVDAVRHSGEDLYTYTSKLFVEPALWIAAALILGALRDRTSEELATVREEAATLAEDRRLIAERHLELVARQKVLEQALSMSAPQIRPELFAGLSELKKAQGDEIWDLLREAGYNAFGRCVLSVHQRDGSRILSTVVGCGGLPDKTRPRRPRTKRALFRAIDAAAPMLTAADPANADLLKGALAAVAIGQPGKPPHAILIFEDGEARGGAGVQPAELESGLKVLAMALEPGLRRMTMRTSGHNVIEAFAA